MNDHRSPAKPLKSQIKCNICHKACPTRNGDWFLSPKSADQQIFVCKECEASAKGAYKRPHTQSAIR
jgi:hypothetical protein